MVPSDPDSQQRAHTRFKTGETILQVAHRAALAYCLELQLSNIDDFKRGSTDICASANKRL